MPPRHPMRDADEREDMPLAEETPEKSLTLDLDAPTLDLAFSTLCQALLGHPTVQDNMASYSHLEDLLGWYANGNHGVAWQHAIQILEGVINTPLMSTTR